MKDELSQRSVGRSEHTPKKARIQHMVLIFDYLPGKYMECIPSL